MQGWGGWRQKLKQRSNRAEVVEFRVTMMCRCIHKCIHKGPIFQHKGLTDATDIGSYIRSPLSNWSPLLVPFHQLWIYMVSKQHSGKADHSALASGGNEVFNYLHKVFRLSFIMSKGTGKLR